MCPLSISASLNSYKSINKGTKRKKGDGIKWYLSIAIQTVIKISPSLFFPPFSFAWCEVSFSVLSISHTLRQDKIFCYKCSLAS